MQGLTALACAVVGYEWHVLVRGGTVDAVWRVPILHEWWGWRRALMAPRVMASLGLLQLALGALLLVAALWPSAFAALGPVASAGLAVTVWLTAVRVRGTLNGGSDGMLFTLLLGLTVATWPGAPARIATGAVVFVAAQVLLSYLRAGLVKVREPAWWRGDALRAFLAIPAYGVPSWVPRNTWVLRAVSVVTMAFELSAPVALSGPRAALSVGVAALGFHAMIAVVLGLHRFLAVWAAALPSVWVAQALLHR